MSNLKQMLSRTVWVVLLSFAPQVANAGTVVFSDTEFEDADWTEVVVIDTSGTFTYSVSHEGSGGNPDAYRRITHQTTVGFSSVALGHLRNGAFYDPSVQGATTTIDLEIDANVFDGGTSLAVGYCPLTVQDAIIFVSDGPGVLENTGWNDVEILGVTASMFVSLDPPGLHPDFSSAGSSIQMGFCSSNGTGGSTPISSESGVDNWQVTVTAEAPAPCEGDANGDGTVDPLDSGFVLARFGCPVGTGDPSCDAADQNGDGAVDPLDSGFVLARFGECP